MQPRVTLVLKSRLPKPPELSNSLAFEVGKRRLVEQDLQKANEQLHAANARISKLEGQRHIGPGGRLLEEEAKQTKAYRTLAAQREQDRKQIQELLAEKEKSRKLNEQGRDEIRQQFRKILNASTLTKARREHYQRLIQTMDLHSLSLLLGAMVFHDDQERST